MDEDDLAGAVDHIGRPVAEFRLLLQDHVIGLDGGGCGSRDGEGAAAVFYREFLEGRQIVRGHSDHLSAGFLEIGDRIAERMRLERAALGERLRIKIEDYGSLL